MQWFPIKTGLRDIFGTKNFVKAVNGINFNIKDRDILGLVGESGCGKTTTGRLIMCLTRPTEGHIYFEGQDITKFKESALKKIRKKMQMIFQDPYEALNPRMSIKDLVTEPIIIHKLISNHDDQEGMVRRAFEMVELSFEDLADKFTHELSGGQRQRAAIARAFVLQPRFIVADEPVSMLDASIRAGVEQIKQFLRSEGRPEGC